MKTPRKSESSVSEKTRMRILRAAEKIFARVGYRAMTLRDVTKEADVNLAAVNYHFGSKTNLMHALIHAHVEPINRRRLQLLNERIVEHAPNSVPLDAIYDALFRPLFSGIGATPTSESTLIQIIARTLTEPANFIDNLHKEFFADLSQSFIREIQRSCPKLSETQIQYRFFLSVSTMIGTVIEQVRLENISGGKLDSTNLDRTLEELTAFVVAGFQQK